MAPCYVIDFTAGWSFGEPVPSDLIGIPARLCPGTDRVHLGPSEEALDRQFLP
jgi:hypothetical protein